MIRVNYIEDGINKATDNLYLFSQTQRHSSGSTLTVATTTERMIIDPSSTISTLSITVDLAQYDGQQKRFSFGGTLTSGNVITAMSFTNTNILGVSGLPSTIEAGNSFTLEWDSAVSKWRIY